MSAIDRNRHPLLHLVAQGAQWLGTDDYPAWEEWADEEERRLRFIKAEGVFDAYLPRLRSPKQRRDEARAEIIAADFLTHALGFTITSWHPPGANGKRGDFLAKSPRSRRSIFVEVKAPGWETQIPEERRATRLLQPKYPDDDETGGFDPLMPMRHAVRKAYPKFGYWTPTLLIVVDDLLVPLRAAPDWVVEALHRPALRFNSGRLRAGGSVAEDGPFVSRHLQRLGAVATLNVELFDTMRPSFNIFPNPNALLTTAVSRRVFDGFPVYDGGNWERRGLTAQVGRQGARVVNTILAPIIDWATRIGKAVARK